MVHIQRRPHDAVVVAVVEACFEEQDREPRSGTR
jgi:hypothetical protein